MAEHEIHEDHGHSVAAWTAVGVILVGSAVASLGRGRRQHGALRHRPGHLCPRRGGRQGAVAGRLRRDHASTARTPPTATSPRSASSERPAGRVTAGPPADPSTDLPVLLDSLSACPPCSTTSLPASAKTSPTRRPSSAATRIEELAAVGRARPRRRGRPAPPGPVPHRRGEAGQPQQGRPRRRSPTPPPWPPSTRRAAPPRSASSPSSAGSTARSTTSTPCARRSGSRCCARTSWSTTTSCSRRVPTAPTSSC